MNLTKLDDATECEMVGNYLWITVCNISVRLARTDEGVICEMYPLDDEADGELLATTYAFFKDAKKEVSSESH